MPLREIIDVIESGEIWSPKPERVATPNVLSEAEAASELGCTVFHLRGLALNGLGPTRIVRNGQPVGYPASEVARWRTRRV